MSTTILVLGESGRGKSFSLKNLNPKETALINVAGKKLPFKSDEYKTVKQDKENYNMFRVSDYDNIKKLLVAMDEDEKFKRFKNIIIDDFQYVMSYEFMSRVNEKSYQKFNDIGSHAYEVFQTARNIQREDVLVVIMSHIESGTDVSGNKQAKIKTVGQLVDNYITFEGLVEVVLYANAKISREKREFFFSTQNDGSNTGKSPVDMFPDIEIPNDLAEVRKYIQQYGWLG